MLNVLPRGSMCQLRHALLLWLLLLFVLVGVGSAGFSYWSYHRLVSTFMDAQMEQLAQLIATNEDYRRPPAVARERVYDGGTYVTQLFGGERRLQASALPELDAGLQQASGFHDGDFDIDHRRPRVTCFGSTAFLKTSITFHW